ncbi:MAG: anti-sigma factor family protein [Thermoleophilaceae bacterium]
MWWALRHPVRHHRDHRFTVANASAYVDGDLDAVAHRRVRAHTHTCPKCRELLASLRRTLTGLGTLRRRPPATDSVVPDVLEALRAGDG